MGDGLLVALGACETAGGGAHPDRARDHSDLEPEAGSFGVGDKLQDPLSLRADLNQEIGDHDRRERLVPFGRLLIVAGCSAAAEGSLSTPMRSVFRITSSDVVVKSRGVRGIAVMGVKLLESELEPDRRLTLLILRARALLKASAYLAHTMLFVSLERQHRAGESALTTRCARRSTGAGVRARSTCSPTTSSGSRTRPVDEVAIWVDNYIRRMIPFPTSCRPSIDLRITALGPGEDAS